MDNSLLETDQVGNALEILEDKMTKVTEGDLAGKCEWFRQFRQSYEYQSQNYNQIIYSIYQCLDKD